MCWCVVCVVMKTSTLFNDESDSGGSDEYDRWEREHQLGDPPPRSLTWMRYLDNGFAPHQEFQVSTAEGLRLAPLGYRMYRYIQKETSKGRLPVMNPFKKSNAGPRMGVPVGGFGSGTIGMSFDILMRMRR